MHQAVTSPKRLRRPGRRESSSCRKGWCASSQTVENSRARASVRCASIRSRTSCGCARFDAGVLDERGRPASTRRSRTTAARRREVLRLGSRVRLHSTPRSIWRVLSRVGSRERPSRREAMTLSHTTSSRWVTGGCGQRVFARSSRSRDAVGTETALRRRRMFRARNSRPMCRTCATGTGAS
jgi:hypothetical protein